MEKRRYSDRAEYLRVAVAKRRKKLRQKALLYKGRKCRRGGYDFCDEALEFHHRNLTQKEFGLSAKGLTRSWEKIKQELDKCDLLCANCHREVHKNAALKGNLKVKKRVNSGKPKAGYE
ncbi:hypothetical protein COS81_02935 [candidate division WWE3 bacterium CG06_land_8_20_14_3_00_42_16]|uniref:HNH endonuclease n=3 Tax=Katanobacteria TaxID=422282 RepID=A0A2M7AMR9_UNCKA|nr:MAG: hypothetical protein COS81_02935 [candidate division WWE3 bacterium CG06_land_8_20_14_3_00_42_16]PIZ43164.1 MAG: hypothetical protein COY34_01440 [candidate division WWE3 bacterium CG_4_10_14_0_2_um_filter_42_8]PJC69112.1 MAG: hypothetical protein CO015_01575 [candidate division WWE3 bacterium CG_4_8_14_3_um_filter_42_11]